MLKSAQSSLHALVVLNDPKIYQKLDRGNLGYLGTQFESAALALMLSDRYKNKEDRCVQVREYDWMIEAFGTSYLSSAKIITSRRSLQETLEQNGRTESEEILGPNALFSGLTQEEDNIQYLKLMDPNFDEKSCTCLTSIIRTHLQEIKASGGDAFALFLEFKALYQSSQKKSSPQNVLTRWVNALTLV